MSQRVSGYERKAHDFYTTPCWVTAALVAEGFREPCGVWEPATGNGHMLRVLQMLLAAPVVGTDITTGDDFMTAKPPPGCDAVITNPPFWLAVEFIRRGLELMKPVGGQVIMLLRTDFDHAKTRADLFAGCPAFAKKIVLTRRIRWFENSTGSPSFNHCWMLWDWQHSGPPTISYRP